MFEKLTDRASPLLPRGTLLIMNDFSQYPKLQIAQEEKFSNQVFTQQQFLLRPTPCIFVAEEDGQDVAKLIVLNMIAEDSKHSSPRVVQIFNTAHEFCTDYMLKNFGANFLKSKN